jgi:alkanesulfonate monooxygenase SsuD/methylene tetrahydromethanopterin reductase-like flavin-dependent oxidoreductase (luciferase family)
MFMKIGIGLPNQVRDVDPTLIPRWAVEAEEIGFSTVGTIGRFSYPGVSDTVSLAAAAGATSRVGLLSHVLVAPAWPARLLAREVAGIDGISGGRLTLGIGVGIRADDFVVDGLPLAGRGKRMDEDLAIYRGVWDGEPVDGQSPAVPAGTRRVPLLFGGLSEPALARAAREGDGYVGPSVSPEAASGLFEGFRVAWKEAGRDGDPRLIATAFVGIGDVEAARASVHDYYSFAGEDIAGKMVGFLAAGAEQIGAVVRGYGDLGVDELMLLPAVDDVDEVRRLADVTL